MCNGEIAAGTSPTKVPFEHLALLPLLIVVHDGVSETYLVPGIVLAIVRCCYRAPDKSKGLGHVGGAGDCEYSFPRDRWVGIRLPLQELSQAYLMSMRINGRSCLPSHYMGCANDGPAGSCCGSSNLEGF